MAKSPDKPDDVQDDKPAPKSKKSVEERLAAIEAAVGIREPAEDDAG